MTLIKFSSFWINWDMVCEVSRSGQYWKVWMSGSHSILITHPEDRKLVESLLVSGSTPQPVITITKPNDFYKQPKKGK